MQKKTSLKDIAEAVNVSTALVSYVLNNKEKDARVNPQTAKEIKRVAKKMSYRPNQVAKSLKSGKSLAIGLIVADISNPFFGYLARTIEEESKKKGYTVIFGSSDESMQKSQELIEALINRQIDGFIIAPAEETEKQLTYLKKANIPFVLIDRYFKDSALSYVVINNFKATYQATQKLLEKGKKSIAFVCYKNKLQHTKERYRGYIEALKDHGSAGTNKLICEVKFNNPSHFKKEFGRLLKAGSKVDAVLFSTNALSIMGLKQIMEMGIRVPEDLALFCFDQSESYDLFYCPISYVHQPLEEIGQKAVQMLIDRMSNQQSAYQQLVLDPELIIKRSSGA
ncbi:MAG: substrate-binding domain-containing protein [Niabella sp.]